MKKQITKAGCTALIILIDIQLRNKQLGRCARKGLEDDRAELKNILERYSR